MSHYQNNPHVLINTMYVICYRYFIANFILLSHNSFYHFINSFEKKGPLRSIKREQQTLPLIHKHSSQVTTLSPFTAKAALAV